MGCPRKEGRISKVHRSIPQDLVMEEFCESKKAVAASKEATRPGGHGADCWLQSERLHHRREDFRLHSAPMFLGDINPADLSNQ